MLDASTSAAYARAMKAWLGRPMWPTMLASLILIALFVGAAALALAGLIPLWAATPVALVAAHAGFTVLHEASHRSISAGARGLGWIDSVLGSIHAAMLLYDFPTFRFLHQRHHAHTNRPDMDPDYWLQRFPLPAAALLSLFVPLHYLRLYLLAARDGAVSRRELTGSLLRIGLLLAVLATALVAAPVETFFLWLAPASLASVLISVSHRLLHEAEVSTDRRRTTRIVTGERFWEWVFCPLFWLNNHHLLHHESPRLPVMAHRKLFAEVGADLEAAGAHIVRIGARPHE